MGSRHVRRLGGANSMGSPVFGFRPARSFATFMFVAALVLSVSAYGIGLFEVGGARASAPTGLSGFAGRTLPSGRTAPRSTSLVLSQVYGGGGNSGAPWHNDFMELLNPTGTTVDVTG